MICYTTWYHSRRNHITRNNSKRNHIKRNNIIWHHIILYYIVLSYSFLPHKYMMFYFFLYLWIYSIEFLFYFKHIILQGGSRERCCSHFWKNISSYFMTIYHRNLLFISLLLFSFVFYSTYFWLFVFIFSSLGWLLT